MRRQIDNVSEMTFSDKLLITFGPFVGQPNHLKTVMDRGLSQDEIRLVSRDGVVTSSTGTSK